MKGPRPPQPRRDPGYAVTGPTGRQTVTCTHPGCPWQVTQVRSQVDAVMLGNRHRVMWHGGRQS